MKTKKPFAFQTSNKPDCLTTCSQFAIGQCRQTPVASDVEWLKKCASTAEKTEVGLTQKLELQTPEAKCKWKFTRIETSEKKSKEEIFEFNVYDLDPKQVNITVVGRSISLEIQTKYRQKIISRYENGKPSYASALHSPYQTWNLPSGA